MPPSEDLQLAACSASQRLHADGTDDPAAFSNPLWSAAVSASDATSYKNADLVDSIVPCRQKDASLPCDTSPSHCQRGSQCSLENATPRTHLAPNSGAATCLELADAMTAEGSVTRGCEPVSSSSISRHADANEDDSCNDYPGSLSRRTDWQDIEKGLQETTSLLSSPARDPPARASSEWEEHNLLSDAEPTSYRVEAKRLLRLACPMTLQNLLSFSSMSVGMAFLGRLSEAEMSAGILGGTFFNVTGLSLLIGLASGLETTCGQAYGAGSYRLLGTILQRGLLIAALVCAGIFGLWTQLDSLMLLAGQDPELVALAHRYLLLCSPALAAAGLLECLKRYLLAQGVVYPQMAAAAATAVLCPLYNFLLVRVLELRLAGSALALAATHTSAAGLMLVLAIARERALRGTGKQTWHGWSWQCLRGWREHLGLAVPATIMLCVEWWAYEALVLMAGLLANPQVSVAVMGVCLNVSSFVWGIPAGLASATSTRVSNELGARRPEAARRATRLALGITCCLGAGSAAALCALRRPLPRLLTADGPVLAGCVAVFPVMGINTFLDALNALAAGILRGSGRQSRGAVINIGSYWGVGVPLGALLAFKWGAGAAGLWGGLLAAGVVQMTVIGIVMARCDWDKEASRAQERVRRTASSCSAEPTNKTALLGAAKGPGGSGTIELELC